MISNATEKTAMKCHPAWLAVGLMIFVVLACSLGKKNANVTTNRANTNDASTTGPAGTGVIKEIHMAKDNGSEDPGAETSSFSPGDHTIHCVIKLNEAKARTKLMFSWWIVDADGTQNEKIKDIEYTTRALENVVHAHLTLPQDWPKGKYKVDVFADGNLEKTVAFNVE